METTVNNRKYIYLNINGVITAIPEDELDRDLINELMGY